MNESTVCICIRSPGWSTEYGGDEGAIRWTSRSPPVSRVQTTSSFPKQCRCVFLLYTSPLVSLFPQKTDRLCCFVVVPFVFMNQPRAKGKGHRLDTNAVLCFPGVGGWTVDSSLSAAVETCCMWCVEVMAGGHHQSHLFRCGMACGDPLT